jgi:hypothetical protein
MMPAQLLTPIQARLIKLSSVGSTSCHKLVAARLGKVQQVLQQLILVLIRHSLHGVADITGGQAPPWCFRRFERCLRNCSRRFRRG